MSAERAGGGAGRRIIVALDYPEPGQALRMAERLNPAACRLKVGKELFTRGGPALVEQLMTRNFSVFLDLKFHDIPNTVAAACKAAAALGVWMINVHTQGGRRMMEAARASLAGFQHPPLLIGVTVLTSMNAQELREVGHLEPPQMLVQRLARLARDSGLDGVVCSAQEASMLRTAQGPDFLLVTPGIRPTGAPSDDQQRVMTPPQAIAAGSDYLVIGRPITGAADPLMALADIRRSIGEKNAD
ncbi:MAG: orotidine-5'-phosphate decarboxylase [Chromatiales bacterium]|jgi:orotidine-5'-phosphate decarboxylase|nr:orotidine-5'-phosphate decarboxylase [Chromatiales bacterium]